MFGMNFDRKMIHIQVFQPYFIFIKFNLRNILNGLSHQSRILNLIQQVM